MIISTVPLYPRLSIRFTITVTEKKKLVYILWHLASCVLIVASCMRYIQSIDPQDRIPTPPKVKKDLGRAGRTGLRRGETAPRRSGSAGDERKPNESTFKKKTLCGVYLHYRTLLSTTVYVTQSIGSRQMLHNGRAGDR